MSSDAPARPLLGVPLESLAFPRPHDRAAGGRREPHVLKTYRRAHHAYSMSSKRGRRQSSKHVRSPAALRLVEVRVAGAHNVGVDVIRRVADRDRATRRVRWGGIAVTVALALVIGSGLGGTARHYVTQGEAAPMPGATAVQAVPFLPDVSQADPAPRSAPDSVLLEVPFTTQAPLSNWAQHQESCEAANLTMLVKYWQSDREVVINSHVADGMIRQIDAWKPQPDLNITMLGEMVKLHYGYAYAIVPNDPQVIRKELAAGRPLIAEVTTHGLGNPNYPGYRSHFEQRGWSVPHFITIIGYDSVGVWLNDPGISKGRGYRITYEQLTHAIDDLNQSFPALNNGQTLLLAAPDLSPPTPPRGV